MFAKTSDSKCSWFACAASLLLLSCAGEVKQDRPAARPDVVPPFATVALVQLSTVSPERPDITPGHAAEADTFAYGKTIVTAFMVGGTTGFATSTDSGATWTKGLLPGLTGAGLADGVVDPSVAYDAAHQVWLISSLSVHMGWSNSGVPETPNTILVSRSTDGIHWDAAVDAGHKKVWSDKSWLVCDNSPTSPFRGHCYLQWNRTEGAWTILVATSTDGGLTWSDGVASADVAQGFGGQPVVRPDGTLVVLYEGHGLDAFVSTDGGASLGKSATVSELNYVISMVKQNAGLSVEVDGGGTIYAAWSSCTLRKTCDGNDLLLTTSPDGLKWSPAARIPVGAVGGKSSYFMPGLAVDPTTSGDTAHLTVAYYTLGHMGCVEPCAVGIGSVTSEDGGKTWSQPRELVTGINSKWLGHLSSGFAFAGDYISASYVEGKAFAAFTVARPRKSDDGTDEEVYTTAVPLNALP